MVRRALGDLALVAIGVVVCVAYPRQVWTAVMLAVALRARD